VRCCVALALVACGKSAPAPPAPGSGAPPTGSGAPATGSAAPATGSGAPATSSAASWTCEPQPFEPSTPLAEASGVAWLDGKLVAVGDSGQHGAYAIIDPETGKTLEQGTLPLGDPPDASDDLEGLATLDGKLVGIASAGWIRVWARTDHGFSLVQGPYALGPVDLPKTGGNGDKPPKGDGMVCPIEGTNCGRNYEGLCLRGTTGFALSKADGHLYPVSVDHGQLVVHREGAIEVARPGVAADCSIDDAGGVWVGNNLFGTNDVRRIGGPDLGTLGAGFAEALLVHGDSVFRMSDTGGAPSLMGRFRCTPAAR
jgi:hypothetical protein